MNAASGLPRFLTMQQALAWVIWRSVDAVNTAKTEGGLSSLKFYSTSQKLGTFSELKTSLLEGLLHATGRVKSLETIAIPPREWLRLRIAPVLVQNQQPYEEITVERSELLACFPELKERDRAGRPSLYNWDAVHEIAKNEKPMSQHKLAEVVIQLYKDQFGKKIALSTMKLKLRSWGY